MDFNILVSVTILGHSPRAHSAIQITPSSNLYDCSTRGRRYIRINNYFFYNISKC